jgi:TPP-dependent pyruvate/acetoin dehydrogenase alpha subunit
MTGRHPATAAQRTELLHRMLLLRRGEEHDVQPGEEAVAVGLRCALGLSDTLVPAHRPGGPALAVDLAAEDVLRHRPAVTVCLVCEDTTAGLTGTLGQAVEERLPVLFCCADRYEAQPAGADRLPTETVDGTDVEAVTLAAHAALHPVRAGAGPRLIHFRTYADEPGQVHDPIRILADRMRTDHQLDENALTALEKHVTAELRAAAAV